MKVSQFIYTSCANNNNPLANGYMIFGKTQDINDVEASEIQKIMNFKLRTKYAFNASPETIDNEFPRNLAFFKLSSGRFCLAQSSYIGLDCAKTRYGNYMIHAFVADNFDEINPYAFVNSKQFRRRLTDEELVGAVPEIIPAIEIKDESITLPEKCDKFSSELFMQFLDFIKGGKFNENDKIFINIKKEYIGEFLSLLSKFGAFDNKKVSFSTYLNSRYEHKGKINILFEEESVSQAPSVIMGTFAVYYFDFETNSTNAKVVLSKYQTYIANKMVENVENALRIDTYVAANMRRFNLDDESYGFIAYRMSEGTLDKDHKYLKVYQENLKKYHPNDIAEKIYQNNKDNLSEEEISILFDDLNESTKEDISKKFVAGVINSSTNGYEELINNFNEAKPCNKEYAKRALATMDRISVVGQNAGSAINAFILSSFLYEISEEELIHYLELVNDRYFGLIPSIFGQYYSNRQFRSVALYIYNRIEKLGLPKDQIYPLFAYLGEEEQKSLVLNRISGLGKFIRRAELEDALKVFGNNTSYTMKVAVSPSVLNAILARKDYLVAALLIDYRKYDEQLVNGIFANEKIRNQNYLNNFAELLKEIRTPEYVSHLSELIFESGKEIYSQNKVALEKGVDLFRGNPRYQVQLFEKGLDKNVFSLSEAYEFIRNKNIPTTNRVNFVKTLYEYRDEPARAYEYAKSHSDEPLAKEYIEKNFSSDLVKKIANSNSVNECLSILDKYENILTKTQLQEVVEKIFSFEIIKVNNSLAENGYRDVLRIIETNNLRKSQRFYEVETYKKFLNASKGDFDGFYDVARVNFARASEELITVIAPLLMKILLTHYIEFIRVIRILPELHANPIFKKEFDSLISKNPSFARIFKIMIEDPTLPNNVKDVAYDGFAVLLSPYKNKARDKKGHEFGLSKEQYEYINKKANYKYGFMYVLFGNKYVIEEKGGNEK